jgi:primosomal protein N' (replication factor Y)
MTSNHRQVFVQVAIPTPLRRVFDYLPTTQSNAAIVAGARVQVPFGNRQVVGVVLGTTAESSVPENRLKAINKVLDEKPLFSTQLLQTLLWAADYYQHPYGEVLATALPARLRKGEALDKTIQHWRIRNPDTVEAQLAALGRAKRQQELLQWIAEQQPVGLQQLQQHGFDRALLKKLENKELISALEKSPEQDAGFDLEIGADRDAIVLNQKQEDAVDRINGSSGFACFLIDGVTGSGKTEIYLRAMEEQLKAGRQCLVLVPEIGLTPQSLQRIERRFSCPVVALHSGLNDTERFDAWRAAMKGQAAIVIGTRSAVFTPLQNPGIIIIDEEHDSSFKQQDGFRYSARDIAIKRAQAENIAVILGSATPCLESLHNASLNKYAYLQLENRAGQAQKPAMTVVDVADSHLDHGFSEQLLFKIEQQLNSGNQVLVFINRRGYAPLLQCQSCTWVSECPNCIAQMTVHARPPSLRCHHCESIIPLSSSCPDCGSSQLNTLGAGTQKLEQFLQDRFGTIPVLRIDRDSTRNKNSMESLLDEIHQGKPAILLGTQMLAKGHHFPDVTLVAVLDADLGLFSPDFRGQEHMAQTIVQVAGRAGRSEKTGEVIIQSRHGSHPSLVQITQLSYSEYARYLLDERKVGQMPPFSHLALVQVEATQQAAATDAAESVSSLARSHCTGNIDLLGPYPAPMEKRAGRYRMHLLCKSRARNEMQKFLSKLCLEIENSRLPRQVRWSVDVDPVDMI